MKYLRIIFETFKTNPIYSILKETTKRILHFRRKLLSLSR